MKFNNDPRHSTRKIALNYIYSYTVSKNTPDIDYILASLNIVKYDNDLLNKILNGFKEHEILLNDKLAPLLVNWNQEQLLDLDILIIKIALLEAVIGKYTPVKVAVDEAVELAKEFGSEKSGKFVNGVLAKLIEGE